VATIGRSLQIRSLFCKRAIQKRLYFAKETYHFKEPTNRSHPILIIRSSRSIRIELEFHSQTFLFRVKISFVGLMRSDRSCSWALYRYRLILTRRSKSIRIRIIVSWWVMVIPWLNEWILSESWTLCYMNTVCFELDASTAAYTLHVILNILAVFVTHWVSCVDLTEDTLQKGDHCVEYHMSRTWIIRDSRTWLSRDALSILCGSNTSYPPHRCSLQKGAVPVKVPATQRCSIEKGRVADPTGCSPQSSTRHSQKGAQTNVVLMWHCIRVHTNSRVHGGRGIYNTGAFVDRIACLDSELRVSSCVPVDPTHDTSVCLSTGKFELYSNVQKSQSHGKQKPIFTNLKEKIRAHRASSKATRLFLTK